MSDFYSGEAHQNVSEFFPRKAKTGKRSIKIPAAKMLAAIAGAAVTATLLFSAFVDCFASEILPTQATLNVSVMNLEREREVEWLLYEEGSDTPVQQGEMDSKRGTIPIEKLDPDTKYRIVFITHTEDGEKQLGEYEFTTPGQKAPAVSPLPSAVPPPPAQPTPPPAALPSPSPSVAPSPSPSPSPSVAPSVAPSAQPQPTVAPSIEPSVEPSVEPIPSPEIPVPSAGIPVLSNITAGTDGAPASMTFNFPFSMNSTADYTNEFADVVITYNSEDYGNPVDENVAVTVTAAPDAEGNVTVNLPIDVSQYGSATAKATLRYNRINVSTGEVETDLTLDSDDLNVQALFVGVESEYSNGLTIPNLEATPATDRLTGTVTIDVGKGTYPAKNSVSQLNVYRIWFDICDKEGNLVNTTRDIIIDYENLSADNSSATITTNFDISIADLGLALGETYELYVRANGLWLLDNESAGTSVALGLGQFKYGEAPVYVEPTAQTPEITEGYPTYAPEIIVQYPFALNSYVPSAGDSITIEETGYDVLYDGTISEEAAFTNTRTYTYDPNGETNEVIIDSQNNVLYINDREGLDNYYPEDIAYSATATFTYENGTKAITSTHNQTPYKFLGNQETNATNTVIPDYDNISIADDICTIPFTATFKDILKGTGQLDVYNAEVYAAGQEQSSDSYQITVGEDTVTITGTAVVDTTQLETIDGINIDVRVYGTWTQDGIELANTNAYTYAYVRLNFNTVTFNRFDPAVDLAGHGITVKDIMVRYDNGYTSIDNYPTGFGFSPGETVETVVVMDVVPPQPLLVTPNHSMTNIDETTIVMADPLQISTSDEYSYFVSFTMPDSKVVVTPSIIISAN